RHRLDGKSVEHGTAELARCQRTVKRSIIDQRAARGIDQKRALLYPCERVPTDESCGLRRHPCMQADNVSARQQLLKRDMLDAIVAVHRAELDIGIGDQELAAESFEQFHHAAADRAIAYDPDRHFAELAPGAIGPIEIAAPLART